MLIKKKRIFSKKKISKSQQKPKKSISDGQFVFEKVEY